MLPSGANYPQYPPPPTHQAQYQYSANPYQSQPQQPLPYSYTTSHSIQQQQQPQQPSPPASIAQQHQGFGIPQAQYYPSQLQGGLLQQSQQQQTQSRVQRQHALQTVQQAQPRPDSRTQQQRRSPQDVSAGSRQHAVRPTSPPLPGVGLLGSAPDHITPQLEDQLMQAVQLAQESANTSVPPAEESHDDGLGEDEESGPIFKLPPPPEASYASEAELEKAIHAWSLEHGYELVRRASKKNAAGALYKRYYHCSKHGKSANTSKLTEQNRVRAKRKTSRMGCPMSLAAVAVDPTNPAGSWQVRHRKTYHNHEALEGKALAGHRRRARMGGVEKAVDGLFAIGTPTNQVAQYLKRVYPDGLFTRTDVANMKLKYKKYGTCVTEPSLVRENSSAGVGQGGRSACLSCRAKKTKCDSVRPVCGTCTLTPGTNCEYDYEPGPSHQTQQSTSPPTITTTPTVPESSPAATRRTRQPPQIPASAQRAATEQILADLQASQADHPRPKRLDLSSSSVEIIAISSCGNGESYKIVPTLREAAEWQTYSSSFLQASLRENTQDVLLGKKPEPSPPPAPSDGQDADVEDWNEYIKQLAIWNRRNSILLSSLLGSLGPAFRKRIQSLDRAADVWTALEKMCAPRGSEQAFHLYDQLHSITLSNSSGVIAEYARRLEVAYASLCNLQHSSMQTQTDLEGDWLRSSRLGGATGSPSSGSSISEDSLCFLFLRNLGEGKWKKWVETVCSKSNIGGFGSGPRLGFTELSHRAAEWESLQGRGGANGVR